MRLKDAIKGRKSVKRFSHKRPNWRKIIRAIDAARFAPSAGNQYVMKYILISDPKKIKLLAQASQQTFVGTAQFVVVAVSDDSKLVRSYGERGKIYSCQQAGASIQNFLLALTEQKLVTTWVGYFYDDQVKDILDIPEKFTVEALFPIGRETKLTTHKKKKPDLQNLLYFDSYGNKLMVPESRIGFDNA